MSTEEVVVLCVAEGDVEVVEGGLPGCFCDGELEALAFVGEGYIFDPAVCEYEMELRV